MTEFEIRYRAVIPHKNNELAKFKNWEQGYEYTVEDATEEDLKRYTEPYGWVWEAWLKHL